MSWALGTLVSVECDLPFYNKNKWARQNLALFEGVPPQPNHPPDAVSFRISNTKPTKWCYTFKPRFKRIVKHLNRVCVFATRKLQHNRSHLLSVADFISQHCPTLRVLNYCPLRVQAMVKLHGVLTSISLITQKKRLIEFVSLWKYPASFGYAPLTQNKENAKRRCVFTGKWVH